MQFTDFGKLDLSRLPSPCFVVDEVAVERNLKILHNIAQASGAKILGALKAFSMWSLADLTRQYLNGTCASGLHEARLGYEEYGGEVHVFAAAFSQSDIDELLTFANHIVFNSCGQWLRFREQCLAAKAKRPSMQFGLRVNPEHSEGAVAIYDPCSPGSRLGITLSQLDEAALEGISGLHFHTLCEQGFEPLQRTVAAFESKFGHLLPKMEWVNFGGGHHITAEGYDVEGLVDLVKRFSERHQLQVYLEPGEAMAIGTGVLTCEVLDITWNQLNQAILDTSATCHMPDTLEMPYRPDIRGAGEPNEFEHTYRLGGLTCLAGDVIDDYSFAEPLEIGQRLIFEDMAHYTMVKTSTFNGTKLPAIALWNSTSDSLRVVKEFDYNDFKCRLS
ncbi:MAG TPA: carboxynorspermidine decarboxylase [Methylophaga aminisulfidivorans]|uniref:Carboxynorspermidine/carboxyspermidine decarboxylase n=1 Tax=Methylophaga aminisulfidivorans TaxID=230105 RepID=A0A7C1VPY7_9GAMM|nr:carboxynorspermidine decarboxylase [Methylophaga aminisulfidivorans]